MTRIPMSLGKQQPFPQGTFIGTLSDAKGEWYASDAKTAPDTKDSYRIVVTLKEITPADDDSPQVGNRPCSQRIDVVRPRPNTQPKEIVSIVDVTEWNDTVPFGLQQSAALLRDLAISLGAATVTDEAVDFDLEQFLEALPGGVFKGQTVMFAVSQRTYDSKTEKDAKGNPRKVTASNISTFSPLHPVAVTTAPVAEAVAAEAPRGLRTR